MPRALNKERLAQFYSGIETLKSGYAYDRRYEFRQQLFDPPNVFVFTNEVPDRKYLSPDRWNLWTVNEQYELVKYVTPVTSPVLTAAEFTITNQNSVLEHVPQSFRTVPHPITVKWNGQSVKT